MEPKTSSRRRGMEGGRPGGALLPEAQTCDKHLYLPEYTSLAEVCSCISALTTTVITVQL